MTEGDQGRPGASEAITTSERTPEQAAWESVFTAVRDFAKLKNRPVNKFLVAESIAMDGDETPNYDIRINPALVTDDGQIEVIVVDVAYMGETSQQWVAKAKWLDGKPKFVDVNPSSPGEAERYFSSYDIAVRAEKILRNFENIFCLEPHNSSGFTMLMPEEYSRRIH